MPYKPKTKFELKDGYEQNDPRKIIYGREFAVEFEAISATFADVQGGFDQIQGEINKLPEMVEEAPADGVIYGRINRSWIPIQGGGGTGGNLVFWEAILDKPEGIATLGYENAIDGGTYNGRFK